MNTPFQGYSSNAAHAAQLRRVQPPRMQPNLECHACSPTAAPLLAPYRSWRSRTHSSTLECLGGMQTPSPMDAMEHSANGDWILTIVRIRFMAWHFLLAIRCNEARTEGASIVCWKPPESGWEPPKVNAVSPSATVKVVFSFAGGRHAAWNSAGPHAHRTAN